MMIAQQRVLELILDSLRSIKKAKMVADDFAISADTILLGMGIGLDSITYVAFTTDLEEKIEDEIGKEFVIKLQEIHDLNENKRALVVKDMSKMLTQIINRDYAK